MYTGGREYQDGGGTQEKLSRFSGMESGREWKSFL